MTTKKTKKIKPTPGITAGAVYRWFEIDWDFFELGIEVATEHHEEIMEILGNLEDAKEIMSGHTGFLVSLENNHQPDELVIKAIGQHLVKFAKKGVKS